MFTYPRRTTPRVRNGRTQRQNYPPPTPPCYTIEQPSPVIDRLRPGRGYRHLVGKLALRRFTALVPQWNDLSVGLNVLILARGGDGCMGWHRPGMVALCAWEREIVF